MEGLLGIGGQGCRVWCHEIRADWWEQGPEEQPSVNLKGAKFADGGRGKEDETYGSRYSKQVQNGGLLSLFGANI